MNSRHREEPPHRLRDGIRPVPGNVVAGPLDDDDLAGRATGDELALGGQSLVPACLTAMVRDEREHRHAARECHARGVAEAGHSVDVLLLRHRVGLRRVEQVLVYGVDEHGAGQ